MAGHEQIVAADLVWTGDGFERDVKVRIDADGRIVEVGPIAEPPTLTLAGRALLPGMVDAHSHAFQRGLRGHGETFPAGAGSFWTWREAMYDLVMSLDRDRIFTLSLQAFREMLMAGITTVGEFHYVHHEDPDALDFGLDEVVLAAAREAGIRVAFLQTYYETGGIGRELVGGQRRFATPTWDGYWESWERLAERLDPTRESMGVVGHSVRAVPIDTLARLHAEAKRRGEIFHIHVEEQRQEVADCRAAYGLTPMALLLERLEIGPETTAVHCTHTEPGDLARYLEAGATVCLCPTTEGNLGDGHPDTATISTKGGLAFGSDSNARISMVDEMRWCEYGRRLADERRGICRDEEGEVGRRLLKAATQGGARSLALPIGAIAPGHWADLVALDLGDPSLAFTDDESLLDAFVFGSRDTAVAEVAVGGRWVRR